jgi:uncharacterized repeat protein (TIGR03803 family)
MKSMKFFHQLVVTAAITFSLALCAQAQTFTTLATFDGGNGGQPHFGSLVQGTNGNYYGTTSVGGKNNGGTVFEVTPGGKMSDIYNFCSEYNCTDGYDPWSGLVLGADGNFYGTTNVGGSFGTGTVFKMKIGGKQTTLYSFCDGCSDGDYPVGLVQASNGNFYGTTNNEGANNGGTIFEISPAGEFKLLYSFCSLRDCADGGSAFSAPMQASNGNLYGTTASGGSHGDGVVYEITSAGLYKVLYNFCSQAGCADSEDPAGGLIQGSNGNLYGAVEYGGTDGYGTVFEITATNEFIVLHSFDYTDGAYPVSALVQANDGNFYGTTDYGGYADGTIYEITPEGVFSSLYNFCNVSGCTGEFPGYALGQATTGDFIGATAEGGERNDGTVFSYSTGLDPLVETAPLAAKSGARVIILGNNLTGSSSVMFNGTAAEFTVGSDTYITATVPTGATTGTVSVMTPGGVLNSNPVFRVLP